MITEEFSRTDSGNGKFPLLTVGLFLLIMAFSFALTLSKNHNEAEDAVTFIDQVTEGERAGLFHPNHLIYNYVNLGFYSVWQLVGFDGNAQLPMQTLNVIASLFTLAIMAFIGWKLGLTQAQNLLALVLLVSCFGYWWYSVEVESYLLPLPFALIAWYQTLQFMSKGGTYRLLIAALTASIAMLVHLQWLALPLALGVGLMIHWWRNRQIINHGKMLASLMLAVGVAAGVVVSAYLAAIFWAYPVTTLSGAVDWVNGSHHLIYRPPWSILNPIKTLVGFLRSIWGGHFLFGFADLEAFFLKLFADKLLVEEIYLGKSIPAAIRWFCVVTSVLAAVLGVLSILSLFTGRVVEEPKTNQFRRDFILTAWMIIAVFFVLNSVIVPTNLELYIGILPAVSLLFLVYLSKFSQHRFGLLSLWGFSILMLATNLFGSIVPQTNRERDYWHVVNQYLIEHGQPSDVIISEGGYVNDSYLQLFSQAQFEQGRLVTASRIDELLEASGEGRVLVSSWVISPPPEISTQLPEYDLAGAKRLFSRYRLEAVAKNQYQTVYQIMSAR